MAEQTAMLGVREAAAELVSLPVWGAAIGVGSFLTVEFGGARTSSVGQIRGALSLWVYGAQWAIREGGAVIADSQQDRAPMAEAANRLNDRRVQELVIDPVALTLHLRLTEEIELIVTPLDDPEMEEWLLFLSDGDVLTAGPAGILTESQVPCRCHCRRIRLTGRDDRTND